MMFGRVPEVHNCCCYFSLSRASWMIGWCTLISSCLVILINCIFLSNLKPDDEDVLLAEYMFTMTIVTKSMQLVSSLLLLIGSYKGYRTLLYCWIVLNTTLTLINVCLFAKMIFSLFFLAEVAFVLLSAWDVYCILVVVNYYREVNTSL